MFAVAWQSKSDLVETRYAPQALNQRATVYALLEESLREIDALPGLEALVSASRTPGESGAASDRAFQVWQATALARYPVTSSVELYGADGALLSRFAFNLPEDLSQVSRSDEAACAWTVAEEVAPFFADERRVFHAGRALCESGGTPVRLDRRARDARLREPAVHRRAHAVRGAAAAQRRRPGPRRTRRRRRIRRLRVEPDAVLFLPRDRLAARRCRLRARRAVARSGLGAAAARRRAVRRLPDERPRRHLRARLPRRVGARPSGEPRRADRARRGGLHRLLAAITGLFGLVARRFVLAPRSCARCAPASTASCSWPSSRRWSCRSSLLAIVARNFVASEMRSGVEREALRTSAVASRVVSRISSRRRPRSRARRSTTT